MLSAIFTATLALAVGTAPPQRAPRRWCRTFRAVLAATVASRETVPTWTCRSHKVETQAQTETDGSVSLPDPLPARRRSTSLAKAPAASLPPGPPSSNRWRPTLWWQQQQANLIHGQSNATPEQQAIGVQVAQTDVEVCNRSLARWHMRLEPPERRWRPSRRCMPCCCR